jgi:hypothetical protein
VNADFGEDGHQVLMTNVPAVLAGMQFSARRARGHEASGGLGDFYDVIPLPNGRWGIAVGDVRDHPFCTTRAKWQLNGSSFAHTRSRLRALAQIEAKPSKVLTSLNRSLLASSVLDRRLLTAIYATVRPTILGARVRVCAAGTPTAFVHRQNGTVVPAGPVGTPLGMSPHPRLDDTLLLLRPGDSLILVTDSVADALSMPRSFGAQSFGAQSFGAQSFGTEPFSAGDGYPASDGVDRLRRVLADLGSASAARSTDTILRTVREIRGDRGAIPTIALALKVPGRGRRHGQHAAAWPGTRRYLALTPPAALSPPDAGDPDSRQPPGRSGGW